MDDMGNTIKITTATAKGLACPPDKTEAFVWDEEMPGFGARLFASGKRTWIIQYRNAEGSTRRMVVGDMQKLDVAKARAQAKDLLAKAVLGGDPQAEKRAQRAASTLLEVTTDYLAAWKRRRPTKVRSYAEVERALQKHARPLHHRKADALSRADFSQLFAGIQASSGPVASNRTRAQLSALYSWAIRAGLVETNPVAATGKVADEKARDRVLTDAELALIWRCTDDGDDYNRIVRLLLLTAARRDEVGMLSWDELTPDGSGSPIRWTLPAARAKNGIPLEVALTEQMREQLPPPADDRSAAFGRGKDGFSGWSKCKERLDERMRQALAKDFLEQRGRSPTDGEATLDPWRLHDLRRTFSTWANESGVEPHVVEAVLNHVSGAARRGVAGTYNRAAYRTQKATALEAWGAHVRSLNAPKPDTEMGNIHPLRRAG